MTGGIRDVTAGVHVAAAFDLATDRAAVLLHSDAPLIVLDPDRARDLARVLTLAAEEADHDQPQPKGHTT